MNPYAYTTMDYRQELERVRRARRRNVVLAVLAIVIVVVALAFFVVPLFGR